MKYSRPLINNAKNESFNLFFFYGFFVGSLTLLSQTALEIFAPLVILCIFFISRYHRIKPYSLLLITLSLVMSLFHFFGISSGNHIARNMLVGILSLTFLSTITINRSFIRGFLTVFIIIGLINFFYNIASFFSGFGLEYRSGDILPRFGGIYGHSFVSISLSTAGFFSCLLLGYRKLLIIFIFALLFTGSLRGPLTAVYLISFWILTMKIRNFWFVLFMFLAFVITTLYSITILDLSSNILRTLAFQSGIESIINYPYFGNNNFITDTSGEEQAITLNYLNSFGIFESTFLNLLAHYGLIIGIPISSFIFFYPFYARKQTNKEDNYASIFIAFYLVYDFLFLNLTSFFPTIIFLIIAVAWKTNPNFRDIPGNL